MDALERRLEVLEQRILGRDSGSNANLVGALTEIAEQSGNAINQKADRISPLFRRSAELERYLGASFAEEFGGVSPEVKAELLLAQENKIKKVHEMLEKVEKKQEILNGPGFQNIFGMQPRLQKLTALHLEQEVAGKELDLETVTLIDQYNQIIETLTETVIRYDSLLKKHEK